MLSLELIAQAQHRLRGLLKRTPLVESDTLGQRLGAKVSLKLECLQKTGSFKPRGAFHKMLTLTAAEPGRRVVAAHGRNPPPGVGLAPRKTAPSAAIVLPATPPAHH